MEINSNRLSLEDVIGVCAKVLDCSNSCKNGGTGSPENERCRCKCVCPPGFVGKECEKAAQLVAKLTLYTLDQIHSLFTVT